MCFDGSLRVFEYPVLGLAALARPSKGDWGQRHQSAAQRGGTTPHACFNTQTPTHNTLKKTQHSNSNQNTKKGKTTSMTKTTIKKLIPTLASLLISIYITACQTTSAAGIKEAVKVLNAQDALVEAVLKERDSSKVQDAVGDNTELAKAEVHLRIALESLKSSNQKLKEALKNDTN
jgi:hypothetical protein